MKGLLSSDLLRKMNAYWRAANYLSEVSMTDALAGSDSGVSPGAGVLPAPSEQ